MIGRQRVPGRRRGWGRRLKETYQILDWHCQDIEPLVCDEGLEKATARVARVMIIYSPVQLAGRRQNIRCFHLGLTFFRLSISYTLCCRLSLCG